MWRLLGEEERADKFMANITRRKSAWQVMSTPPELLEENRESVQMLRVPTASHQEHLSALRVESLAQNMPHAAAALSIIVVGASGDLAKKKTFP